jgi:hypothetical protein
MAKKTKSIFDLPEFEEYKSRWDNRQNSLKSNVQYYDGSVYQKTKAFFGFLMPRLYGGIKPLYLPLSRAVDIDAGIIPGGWSLPTDEPNSKVEKWQAAINTVFDWSKWDTDGVLFVHYGAQSGLTGLRIADLREEGRVIIQPVNPLKFMLVGNSIYTDQPEMAIWVEELDDGKPFEYAEIITPESIRTFRDGIPTGFDGREEEYKNEIGFVPYVESAHINTGSSFGEATFKKSIPLLDEVNQLASYLADIIQKNTDVQWVAIGVEPSDLEHGGDTVWFAPQGAEFKPIVPGVDIDGVLKFIQEIAKNVKESLPELSFDDIRGNKQIATETIELQLMELILKVKRTRPNYDRALTTALQMAGRAAKTINGLGNLAILDDEELRFDPKREIIPPDVKEQLNIRMLTLQVEALERETVINEGV